MNDPVAAYFLEVAREHARCFWLDGGGARDWSGNRSIIGWLDDDDVSLTYDAAARQVTRHRSGRAEVVGDDVFDVLAAELAAEPDGQWFGYLGYACRPDLAAHPGGPVPDAVWLQPRTVRMFEHDELPSATLVARSAPPAGVPRWYAEAFDRVQEELRAGNTYEANLTHRATIASDLWPPEAYLRLRTLNPAPYAGFLQHDVDGARAWLLSSSPERYALVTDDRVLETKPIKGTTPRGATPEEDEIHRASLASDPRFRAENLMIVDLLRNDVSMVCEPGTVAVPSLMTVESYENVHQLVSTVRGRLRDDVSTLDALRALFPAGSMTGRAQATDHGDHRRRRADSPLGVRGGVRLDRGRWTRGPRGRDPQPLHRGRRRVDARHRRRHHGPLAGRRGVRRDGVEGRPATRCLRRLTAPAPRAAGS